MTQRMQANLHPQIVQIHDVEHDEKENCDKFPPCVPVLMMQGYTSDGAPDASDYHGDPHPYDEVCNDSPVCRQINFTVPAADVKSPWTGPLTHVDLQGPTWTTPPTRDWKTPPAHYSSASGIQPWDVIDEFNLDFYSGNALKYILRAGKKDIAPRLDDLIKARNYINKAIDMEENRDGTSEPG